MDGPNTSSHCSGKKPLAIKFFVLIALWAVSFIPVYPSLVETWLNHGDNSHGILVPLISLSLIWRNMDRLKSAEVSSCGWGGFVLVISMILYLLGFASGTEVISRCMIVSSLIGLILFTLGREVFTILAFPLLFLVFIVPVPVTVQNVLAFPLQLLATKIAYLIIQGLSIPVHQEGNMLYFSQAQLEVAEACSGIRSIVSFTVLSVIFAYALDKGWARRIALLASAIPLALFTNIVRVTGTGILAHFYGSKIASGFLHEFSGLIVFAFGFVFLLLEFMALNKTGATKTA